MLWGFAAGGLVCWCLCVRAFDRVRACACIQLRARAPECSVRSRFGSSQPSPRAGPGLMAAARCAMRVRTHCCKAV
eukprot:11200045-Lingulodinium_polyedra.AAC.1